MSEVVGREEPDDILLSRRSVMGIVWPGRADLRRSGLNRPILTVIGSVLPELLEAVGRKVGVPYRMRDVLVPEVMLQGPGVVALVGQLVAAGVAQHMWVHRKRQLGR